MPFASNLTSNGVFYPWCQINLKRWRSASNCIELISTQFSILEMCDCVCLCVCVCVCARNVCVWCVCSVCVWVWVCVILLLYTIKHIKNVWCVHYTHTHSLTLTHSRSHALAHLHARTCILHPKRVNMCRL